MFPGDVGLCLLQVLIVFLMFFFCMILPLCPCVCVCLCQPSEHAEMLFVSDNAFCFSNFHWRFQFLIVIQWCHRLLLFVSVSVSCAVMVGWGGSSASHVQDL